MEMEKVELGYQEFSLRNVVLIEFDDDQERLSFQTTGTGNNLLKKVFSNNDELTMFYALLIREEAAPITLWDECVSKPIKKNLEELGIYHGLTIRIKYKNKHIFFSFGLKNKMDHVASFYLNFIYLQTFTDPNFLEEIIQKFKEDERNIAPTSSEQVH